MHRTILLIASVSCVYGFMGRPARLQDISSVEHVQEELQNFALEMPRAISTFDPTPGCELIGLVELPFSGSTWLRFLLAGAIGFPSCAQYSNGYTVSCYEPRWESYCPCTPGDFAKFSPRGYINSDPVLKGKQGTVNESDESIQAVTDAFEYRPGVRVHKWTEADGVMLRHTHLWSVSSMSERFETQIGKMIWIVRHPLDIKRSFRDYEDFAGRDGVDTKQLNEWYSWFYNFTLAHESLVIAFENLCVDTAGEFMRALKFMGKADAVTKNEFQTMLQNFPELACRYSAGALGPTSKTREHYGSQENALLEELAPAIAIWRQYIPEQLQREFVSVN